MVNAAKMMVMGGYDEPKSLTHMYSNGNASVNADTYTWSAVDIGPALASRLIIVLIAGADGSMEDPAFTTAVTIGGVSATQHQLAINTSSGYGASFAGIYSALVPSGTTADVVITLSSFAGVFDAYSVSVYRGVHLNSNSPIASLNTTDPPFDLNTSGALAAMFAGATSKNIVTGKVFSGGGNTVTLEAANYSGIHGWDDSPLGGSTDTYDSTALLKSTVAGCWG